MMGPDCQMQWAVSEAEGATKDGGIERQTEHDIRRVGESNVATRYGLPHLLPVGIGTSAITSFGGDRCLEWS